MIERASTSEGGGEPGLREGSPSVRKAKPNDPGDSTEERPVGRRASETDQLPP